MTWVYRGVKEVVEMYPPGVEERLRRYFSSMLVFKGGPSAKMFSGLSIPSYMRDWLLMRFASEDGSIDAEEVESYIRSSIPQKEDWSLLKAQMINERKTVTILAKVRADVDVREGYGLFQLPDLGFPSRKLEAAIDNHVLDKHKESLLSSSETWGVISMEWRSYDVHGKDGVGTIYMTNFTPFRPYHVDPSYYCAARNEFTIDEWVDILLAGIDYNPKGFRDISQKLTLLSRILPFIEPRLNLIELAPKATGKSYVYSQLSKYGWLVSGGSVSRARLFYDIGRKEVGLISRYDYVALDEIQTIVFPKAEEVQGALKGYLENGEYRVGDYRGVGQAGFILLGNIRQTRMDEDSNMFGELPSSFQESALIDRFHGFIPGWQIPRIRENMKVYGWALNVEYLTEMFHAMRDDLRYRQTTEHLLSVPGQADRRDTEAVKRICTAYLKLLFPNAVSPSEISRHDFQRFCFEPALRMRGTIRRQLHLMDAEYSEHMPHITVAD